METGEPAALHAEGPCGHGLEHGLGEGSAHRFMFAQNRKLRKIRKIGA